MPRSAFRLFLFAFCLFAGTAWGATPRTILVFGDSLSAGFGIAREQAWPALLDRRLQEKAMPYQVANASISGETTRGGLARLDEALARFKPAVVILALGANDGLRGLPVRDMQANLRAMIDKCRAGQARVVLVGMRLPPNYGPDYVAGFEKVFADVARAHRLPLVPFMLEGFADRRESFQADGLHPVAAAQPRVLDNIWPALAPLLRQP